MRYGGGETCGSDTPCQTINREDQLIQSNAFCADRIRKIDTIKKSHASGNEVSGCQYDCPCDDGFSAHFVFSAVFSFIYMSIEYEIEEDLTELK